MAAVNLPDNPANGTTQTVGGITYTYNSSKGYWTAAASSGGGGGGGASVTTDDSAPGSPSDGDLWYDTDDGGMFVYYQDTDSSQWVEVIGSQGAAGPAGAAGAAGADGGAGVASVYATVSALPLTGNTQGDMAHVTANNTLYFWNGSGWYKIALINTNPSISGANSGYVLAQDGTATTVTLVASDPEGIPITYSIASDTSGNIATVSQGTGASTNVFTITPSTNTAYAGSFTLTFRASDGVNVATAASSFTLAFNVQNQRYTTALVTSVGANNAVNNSFDDKSTSDHTITANGDVNQTTFSPYRHGGYSTYFDGSGDYLTSNSNGIANFGTGAFTVEGWLYLVAYPSQWNFVLDTRSSGSDSNGFCIEVTPSDFGVYAGENMCRSGSGFGLKEWKHWAYTRDSSGNHKVFINGTQVGSTFTGSKNYTTDNFRVSAGHNGGDNQNAYQRDLRVIKGTALYTANFTPPTAPLTAVTNTSFLGCHLPYIADGSTNAHTITISGDPATKPFVPYDKQGYAAADHLGSAGFDGSGDYLEIDDGTWLTLGNGNFCFETWIYNTATSGGSQYIFGQGNSAGQANSISAEMYINSNRTLTGGIYVGSQKYATSTGTIPTNTWTHVALVRNGANIQLYINGTKDGENTSAGTDSANDQSTHFSIGRGGEYNGLYFNGHITDFRFVKGSSVHTGNFTPPTAPLTAITNTELLVQNTDAGIIDKSQSAQKVVLYGNVKSSTTQSKYLSSSIYFDGTGDYMRLENQGLANFGTQPFTIEGWFYLTASPSNYITVLQSRNTSWSTTGWEVTISASDFYFDVNGSVAAKGSAISQNTWYHYAVTRDSSNNVKLFLDGTQVGSTATVTNDFTLDIFWLGAKSNVFESGGDVARYFTGYMSDVRLTKGYARYTSNFTAPTAALEG